MDSGRLNALGWRPALTLEDGVRSTYRWYLENGAKLPAGAEA